MAVKAVVFDAFGTLVRPVYRRGPYQAVAARSRLSPDGYADRLRALGLLPHEILFVGDTPAMDVDGPRAFGMKAEAVNHPAGAVVSAAVSRHVVLQVAA